VEGDPIEVSDQRVVINVESLIGDTNHFNLFVFGRNQLGVERRRRLNPL
jgi:hypothetical protein